ncbi:MAG: hypothetical protein KIT84_04195 [Labilithrix sp.]|nr:hypothetical protein [Labilithrix sp.]MCW5810187.1 hypothetical protein [Labilithrix sp.]
MRFLSSVVALSLVSTFAAVGCSAPTSESESASTDDADLSEYSFSSWHVASTMHVGETIEDSLAAPGAYTDPLVRVVHPIFIGATPERPVRLTIDLEGVDATKVQGVLLAPLEDGRRATIANDGQSAPKEKVELTTELTKTGVYLLAVSTHKHLTGGRVRVSSHVPYDRTNAGQTDALVSPQSGELSGRTVTVKLNPFLADQEIELWASWPGPWSSAERRKLGSTRSVNHEASFTIGEGVDEGDELFVVVPAKAPGTDIPLDSGTVTRFWTRKEGGVRTDLIGISDFGNSLTFTGVAGFYEGGTSIMVVSADRKGDDGKPLEIASTFVRRDRPGQLGMGYAMFDTSLGVDIGDPRTPRTGEILAVGTVSPRPSFHAMTCFRFCNDLSGLSSCEREEVPCPEEVQTILW